MYRLFFICYPVQDRYLSDVHIAFISHIYTDLLPTSLGLCIMNHNRRRIRCELNLSTVTVMPRLHYSSIAGGLCTSDFFSFFIVNICTIGTTRKKCIITRNSSMYTNTVLYMSCH